LPGAAFRVVLAAMSLVRSTQCVSLLLAALWSLSACGSDSSDDPKKSGTGGAASGGTSSGGTSSGGSPSGGAAGSGGSATGGASGAGGASGGAAGSGGTGGTGGSAGSGTGGSGGAPISPPVPDDCITDVSAKPDHVFDCSGLKWNMSVPPACVTNACGLIFDVHGFTMSGKMEDNNTKLVSLGAKNGFIVVNPNADPAPPLASWTAATDDPKVFDFMQRTINAFHVDPKRVHFTGFSQGGDMSWRFLCDHADVIASAAPAAFGQSADEKCFSKGKAPVRQIPILYMHGTKDALVNFSAAQTARDAVIAVWGLTKSATVSSDATHNWDRYTNASGALFEFIQHDYTGAPLIQGHCYPGSTDPSGEPGQLFSFKCNQTASFNWGEAVVQFFLAHPM
jgi:hypothetical protein